MNLDAECFEEHLSAFEFRQGAEAGRWGLHSDESVKWPNAVLWVAAPPRDGAPERFYLFFNLSQYPKLGPTAHIWDPNIKTKLDTARWPKGINDVNMAFRATWNNAEALYVPWDRVAAAGHPEWPKQHAGLIWDPSLTIAHYLRLTHELLHSGEYHGI